jgi:hypothetical protein
MIGCGAGDWVALMGVKKGNFVGEGGLGAGV